MSLAERDTNISVKNMILDIAEYNWASHLELIVYYPSDTYRVPHRIITIRPGEILESSIEDLVRRYCTKEGLPPSTETPLLGLSSRLKRGYSAELHLPQIDFATREPKVRCEEILEFLSGIEPLSGFVLGSGNSYHYQSRVGVTIGDWKKFMEMLDSHGHKGLVDGEWVDISTDLEYSCLRICADTNPNSKRPEPKVLLEVGDIAREPSPNQMELKI